MASDHDRGSPSPSSSRGVQKHRACDECRSRKLACSKEHDGCSRCRREGLRCHYSAQKPMGRPRKRRNLDDDAPLRRDQRTSTSPLRQQKRDRHRSQSHSQSRRPLSSVDAQLSFGESILPQTATTTTTLAPVTHAVPDFAPYDASGVMPLDPSLGFLDDHRHSSGMDLLDMVSHEYATTAPGHDAAPIIAGPESMSHTPPSFNLDLGCVDLLGGIGFEQQSHAVTAPRSAASHVMHSSFDRYMTKTWEQSQSHPDGSLAGSTPPRSSSSSEARTASTSSSSTSLRPNPNITCGCLSSLYLTLDCLGNLPSNIPAAIRTVRNAVRVAHATIHCELCSCDDIVNQPAAPVPIQAFQNLMLLAALVPSACNAYATILERIDIEADRARRNHEELWFSFREIGGNAWDAQAEQDKDCVLMQGFNDKKMPPDMWRAAVREIIRADVDGAAGPHAVNEYGQQKGLRDVVRALEERSHKRHTSLDAAAAMGKLPRVPLIIQPPYQPVPVEDRNCMRVLDAARMALNNLVIV